LRRAWRQSGAMAFDAIGPRDETVIPRIASTQRFRCSELGARDYADLPDWRVYRAPGMARASGAARGNSPIVSQGRQTAISPTMGICSKADGA